LIINDTVANEQDFVLDTISAADGIFIAGGDQNQYYTIWGTASSGKITKALNKRAQSIPIGGTSAGKLVV
jgi:cyanophycinase